MYDLTTLGWNKFFEEPFGDYRNSGYLAGRVGLEHRGAYRLYFEGGELLAEITGRLRFDASSRADFPAVGDWVAFTGNTAEVRASIHAVLPRRSKFSRKAAGRNTEEQIVAANVDTAFLVVGLDLDYNPRRVERYLVAALESGANPVVILSKLDLCDEVERRVAEVESIAGGVPVHAMSSVTSIGLDELNQYLGPGLTAAFLGSSGVGKSTLINRLVGSNIQKVKEVRAHDNRGRHTTTHRELIILPSGGLLIDTPGMRELQLWDSNESFSETFSDIESLAASCRFSDCSHGEEPGCVVREGLRDGSLDEGRYENYRKLQKELEFLESRQNVKLQQERKESEKRAHRVYRRMKHRGKFS
jgi:ribosome biogenesis GTPase